MDKDRFKHQPSYLQKGQKVMQIITNNRFFSFSFGMEHEKFGM